MADEANLTIASVLDRCHAIHETISGLHHRRYYPSTALSEAQLPMIVPLYQRGAHRNDVYGPENIVRNRTFNLVLWAGNLLSGLPTQSASVAMETYTELLLAAYAQRPRLQLTGSQDALNSIVEDCFITGDQVIPSDNFLIVQFTLLVPVIHTIERY